MSDKPLINKEEDYGEGKDELASGDVIKTDEEREWTDVIFIPLFYAFFIGSVVCGVIAWQNMNHNMVSDINWCYKAELYSGASVQEVSIMGWKTAALTAQKELVVLSQSVDLFCLVAILALYLGFFWVTILDCCVAVIIYVAVYFIPVALIGAGIFAAVYLGPNNSDWYIGGGIIAAAGVGGVFLVYCLFQDSITATIDLFDQATDFMEDSPMMFACSFANIIFKFLLLLMFLAFFGLGAMTTYFEKQYDEDGDPKGCKWHKSKYFDYYMWYQVVAFLWTLSLVTNLNIGTVAGSSGMWYFGDEAQRSNSKENRTCTALKWCLTKSFGSLALGALISTFIILMQTYLIYLRETLCRDEADDTIVTRAAKCLLRCVINCMLAILQCLLRFVTYFATIYLVSRGESFCSGAKKCFNLLKRNGLSAMVVDSFTSWFVLLTQVAVSLLLGFMAVYILHAYRDASTFACTAGFFIAFIITLIIFGIFTDIVMAVVDSMYVFNAIDEDSGRPSKHKSAEKMKEIAERQRAKNNPKSD